MSNLGDGLYQFALPVLALTTTQSPALVAGVTVMLTLAWPLFGLQAGAVVDRFDRRSVLVAVSALRFGTLALLTVAIVGGWLSLPLLYLAAAILGIGETLADTALTAIVPSVVESDALELANSRIVAGQTVTNTFIGPPLAGALLGIGGAALTGVGAGLYALTAAAMALLRRRPSQTNRAEGADRVNGLTAGFRFLWRHSLLRRLTLFTAAMNVWWAGFAALFTVYAISPGPMGLGPPGLGVLFTAMAIGGLVGTMLTQRIVATVGVRATLALDFIGTALLVGVPAVTTHPIAVGMALAVAGAATAWWVVLVASIRQRVTPDGLLGRAYSASRMISWGVLPIGAVAAGLAAEFFGVRAVFAAGAVVTLGLLVGFLATVSSAELERTREPAVQLAITSDPDPRAI
jgi:MFS family permease